MNSTPPEEALALYIHWPFCVSKCPYCDFNSHVRESVDQNAWRAAMLQDLAYEAAQLPGKRLTSIFFGGGTPSLMPPETVAALIDAAAGHWDVADDIEITLEANPSSVEAARFGDLSRAGVNRVSLGLQALDDEMLGWLGRAHDVREGLGALDTAQAVFARVSFDLIYARPGQTPESWRDELARALSFGTEHLSLYQLTIEPGTQFAARFAKGELPVLDPDLAADLFEQTRAQTVAAGLPAYEISNHARPGAESRHNLTYWRYGSYAGVGPGAHGRRGGMATVRRRKPENWLSRVDANGHGIESEEILSPAARAQEALLMGLRLREGVDLERVVALSGMPIAQLVDGHAIERLEKLGFLERSGSYLRISEAGVLLLDAILAEVVSA
ncbi:coproporphyrinogen III oxidase [Sphingomonas sp. Root710]|uniref:radical SAM family heme chaperone HemW n=1 Tax=Sphingomonas sp. Root710 TaxID=1736594 RepID=UPI000700B799|nr:radical SAM family heme chaperone HemW [Sphingomonas sp. Root710]KRB85852.1 coproporphyrinogen III oxidase [Sphingomonas sp. Root710]